jgi:transposase
MIDSAMDGPAFRAYIEQVLVPTLQKGDIIFMDNVQTHKVAGMREAIDAAGATRRFLPAYSPDPNPIRTGTPRLSRTYAREQCEPLMRSQSLSAVA